MISLLEGTVEFISGRSAIINTGSVGYTVALAPKMLDILAKTKEKVKLFIYSKMNTREGTFDLYGFGSKDDLDLFYLLISVSGIGPKNAMNIMTVVEPQQLKAAVIKNDAGYLKQVSGLGSKTAQRLVLELHNKIEYLQMVGEAPTDLGQEGQALEALMSLGYSQSQALEALKEVPKTDSLQERVRSALKLLAKK